MNSKRPARRTSRSARTKEEAPKPAAKRKARRVAKKDPAVEARPSVRHARLGSDSMKSAKKRFSDPKAPDIARTKRAKKPPASTRTVHLAMSPNAANILRAMLGKANHDVPELEAIRQELEEQCS